MIECLILGDSIAQGVAQSLPACESRTWVGITSEQFVRRNTGSLTARHVLISLGSNDGASHHTFTALQRLRSDISGAQVTWLLSANNPRASEAALQVSRMYEDRVIQMRPLVGRDGVHPTSTGYNRLAHIWRYNWEPMGVN